MGTFDNNIPINRRIFLEKSILGIGGLSLIKHLGNKSHSLDTWPESKYLGRNTVYLPSSLPIRSNPSIDAPIVRYLTEDECIPWLREVIGNSPIGRPSRKWVETPEGYIYGPSLQKVQNIPNQPITELPIYGEDQGLWVEVTVPYVNLELANPPAKAPWLSKTSKTFWRLYYSQVIWVDEIQTAQDGHILYRVNERYGSYGDIFYADAEAFRPVTEEEIAPINPEVGEKKIVININQQSLSCFEGNNEVYGCRVSTGRKLDDYGLPVDTWATPTGTHWVWRKLISLHMSGGGTGAGWDTMSIPWTSLFVGEGVAVHSTFWHNDFGTPKSHGCVNTLPEDAKWIFRWTTPQVAYNPGDITTTAYEGTRIEVVEPLY
ncbi:MAG: L,D-transpeptidase [Anaerolineaceae bacterium]|nr:L,D-transpeptidase [Anaerolineaceae bacterium]